MSVVVWFKRDLRWADHAPLAEAARLPGHAVGLFVIEPEWLSSPECDPQHVAFTLGCLAELRQALSARGLPLVVRVGRLLDVLAQWRSVHGLTHLLSHEETGSGWTYQRDVAVGHWCRAQGVIWQEFSQTGVVRRLRSRNGWAAHWQQLMDAPLVRMPSAWSGLQVDLDDLPDLAQLGMPAHGRDIQAPGVVAARAEVASFLRERGQVYRKAISSPSAGRQGCSRLSPYLAYGCVSMRQVHQATERRIALAKASDEASELRWAQALRSFAGRLRWHCHFMQKLEDEPAIEFHNMARHCDGLREGDFDEARFEAWCEGRTGYPMVDACMRSLRATGWLNFRMRAMLVSFASYHLWLHWRRTGHFLARQFLDFEPGIHWSQMQMQSGTTGINTLRIYSPTKQAQDHDPDGRFIRQWLPELAQVPWPHLATPWRMSLDEQHRHGCVMGQDYPEPIVDDRQALKQAKDRLYALRQTDLARQEADAIQRKHGSRKAGLPRTGRKKRSQTGTAQPDARPADQFSLFGDQPITDDAN